MAGHDACFLGGPRAHEVVAYPQEKPHNEIRFSKPQQSYWSTETIDLEAMVEIGYVVYRLLGKSFVNPRLYYYEHVEG